LAGESVNVVIHPFNHAVKIADPATLSRAVRSKEEEIAVGRHPLAVIKL
jgi:hypothetical protein